MSSRTRQLLAGPPIALPPAFDALAERWWRARPRSRLLVGVSAVIVVLVAGTMHAASSPFGPPVRVWVSDRDLDVGEVLTSADVREVDWPAELAPDGALGAPQGSLVAPLPRGAVVTDRHVGDGGIAAVLPDETVAVAVPLERIPQLAVGMHVDLVAADLDGAARTLAHRAIVVGRDEVAVWFAVAPQDATNVTGASLNDTLGAVVLPP